MRQQTGTTAVVAARADEPPVETAEIRALAEAAGYEVRDAVTQVRTEDPGTYFGTGKVAEIADRAADADASATRSVISATFPVPKYVPGSSARTCVTASRTS